MVDDLELGQDCGAVWVGVELNDDYYSRWLLGAYQHVLGSTTHSCLGDFPSQNSRPWLQSFLFRTRQIPFRWLGDPLLYKPLTVYCCPDR